MNYGCAQQIKGFQQMSQAVTLDVKVFFGIYSDVKRTNERGYSRKFESKIEFRGSVVWLCYHRFYGYCLLITNVVVVIIIIIVYHCNYHHHHLMLSFIKIDRNEAFLDGGGFNYTIIQNYYKMTLHFSKKS